ncbi:MAG: hypothetical protein H7320_00330 [Ferruginibacter sp.]|nr:hypothetical protein [Ferruginibacter sp.]
MLLDGSNDPELIYTLHHLNLMRQPNEASGFFRRTGYSKTRSAYYSREPFGEKYPAVFGSMIQ